MNAIYTKAIAAFESNLALCCDMTDRKNTVRFLANIIGATLANQVAFVYGLNNTYYMAYN